MTELVPIMRMGDNLLVMLQGDLEDRTVEEIEREITREVSRTQVRGALIDVSGLSVVDSFVARVISRIVAMIRLLGAEATIVGVQPAVAITLVELGVPLRHVNTALSAEQGMARLRGQRDEYVH